jgi:hypothetical protein
MPLTDGLVTRTLAESGATMAVKLSRVTPNCGTCVERMAVTVSVVLPTAGVA